MTEYIYVFGQKQGTAYQQICPWLQGGIFAKLSDENRSATIHSFLVNRELFAEEEQTYLLAYLKKNRTAYLEKYIQEEDYPALEACFAAMPKVKTLMEEFLTTTEQYGKQQVNLFLMQLNKK